MGDYIADRITTTSRFQEVKISDFPTITICMNPPQKSAVAKKFGFKNMQDIHFQEVENLTLLERFEAISYKLNQDFYINDLKILRSLEIGNNEEFIIEPIVTYFKGICYKLEPKFKINSQFEIKTFSIEFSKEIKDLPTRFDVYLTSKTSTLNICNDIWPQYPFGKVSISLSNKNSKITNIQIQYRTIEYIFKTGVDNSDECMTKVIKASKCSTCFFVSGTSLPFCNSTQDLGCIWNLYNHWHKCLLNKHVFAYVPQINEIQTHGYNSNASAVFYISAASKSKQIMEEIDVITLAGLIGSIGGSLGMFFGFSFTSYLSILIEKLIKKMFKN